MIYLLLFWEFFKVGLLAIGGGLVTVPFLFELSDKYAWFSHQELADMIAISESTPGPLGVNMATYAGFNTAGILGGVIATIGLTTPSVIVIVWITGILSRFKENPYLQSGFYAIRPAVVALILGASLQLFRLAVVDILSAVLCVVFFAAIHFIKIHPIVYILLGMAVGIVLKL